MALQKKITIIGDSLAGERPDGLSKENRWPQMLAASLGNNFLIINLSKGSSTTNRIAEIRKQSIRDSAILIIQLGIVDCAPRYFSWLENKFLNRLPVFLRKEIIAFVKKSRIQSADRAYVKPEKFEKNLANLNINFKGEIFYIKVLEAGKKYSTTNPLISKYIEQYNLLIDKAASNNSNFKTIKIGAEIVDQLTFEDGYHLNQIGHKFVAQKIAALIADVK
ncbi:MAG: hypothetical protein RJA07_2031 [Bacteroidota bacterium]|jgi:lysophospholipase L1-like esterase